MLELIPLVVIRLQAKCPVFRTDVKQCTIFMQLFEEFSVFLSYLSNNSYTASILCGKWWYNTEMDVFFTTNRLLLTNGASECIIESKM